MKLQGKYVVLILALAGALPLAATYLSLRAPAELRATTNYGELLQPRPMPAETLQAIDGQPFELARLRGRWVLVVADPATCDQACRQRLYYTRQVRTALGKDMHRVERVWLLSDDAMPESGLRDAHPGLHLVRGGGSGALALLRENAAQAAGVFLVDPLGNLMLRYPPEPDAKRMLKDLQHLLRVSRVG